MVISDMFLKEKGKSWEFTGGSAAAGRFAENEGRRGCAGLFEEVIRWDMAMDSMAARERFVFNTARPGLNAVDIVEEFGRRAACYHPQGVVYISGSEDEALAEEVLQGALGEMERLGDWRRVPLHKVSRGQPANGKRYIKRNRCQAFPGDI